MIASKRGQQTIGLSFGMIFSIILIVVFLIVAFLVLRHFLNLQKCSSIGLFLDDLQQEVDGAWKSSSKKTFIEVDLPSQITHICFGNLSLPRVNSDVQIFDKIYRYRVKKANLFLFPSAKACGMEYFDLKHIDIDFIMEDSNPNCMENTNLRLELEKGFYESLVKIKKA